MLISKACHFYRQYSNDSGFNYLPEVFHTNIGSPTQVDPT